MSINDEDIIKKRMLKGFLSDNIVYDLLIKIMIFSSSFCEISIAWVMQSAINSISDNESMDKLIQSIIFAAVVLVVVNLLNYLLQRLQNLYIRKFSTYLKENMFYELLKKDIVEFENINTGDYVSAFQTDIQRLISHYINGKWIIIKSISTCVLGIVSMISMSLKLSVLIIVIQIIPISLTLILGKRLQVIEKKASESRGNFNSHIQDYLNGFRLIKLFSSEENFMEKFSFLNFEVEKCNKEFKDKSIYISLVNNSANFIMVICLFLIGGIEVIRGRIGIGTVIACFELLNIISHPLSSISAQINLIRASNVLFKRIFGLFYLKDQKKSFNKVEELSDVENITLENVSFSYENGHKALSNISFTFQKGKKYALVGNSGSGKTTLMKLIMGYYDNYDGKILVNDKELRNINVSDVSREISLVQQDVFIFNDTVLYNITLNKDFEEKDIKKCIENSGLSGFFKTHDKDYICGENGINLSGGEKQRISISRSLLKKSSVIVFDEATSSLDNITAAEIEKTINKLDQTCISITHRMSLDILNNYDEILVLNNGTICETGTVDELMKNGELFKSLYYSSVVSDTSVLTC